MDRERIGTRGRALMRKVPAVDRVLRRMRQQDRRLNRQRQLIDELLRRVTELESEVQECRRLNKRIAEVTDIVAEVLMPATHRDDDELRRRLKAYAKTL